MLWEESFIWSLAANSLTTYHASRVLPGFNTGQQNQYCCSSCSDQAEVVLSSSMLRDIEKNKVRGDLGITYDLDVLRLIDSVPRQRPLCGKRCYCTV